MAGNLKRVVRSFTRSLGWEIRRYVPDLALDAYLPFLFQALDINCVLDIGGRIGDFGTLLRTNNYKGYILSFEPIESNIHALHKRKASDSRWHIYQYALGSRNEASEINVAYDTGFSSFFSPSDYGKENYPGIAVKEVEAVQVRRLDDVFDTITSHIHHPRVYLKMDTQGWDLEILRGAKGCLDRIVGLQSELSLQAFYKGMPNWTDALSEFQQAGFVVSAMFPVARDDSFQLSELDCVMVRNKRLTNRGSSR